MLILALDTSSKAASCALWQDGALRGEYFAYAGLTHSQTIMPMVQALLRHTHTGLEQVDRFAVSAGPGSFTGLRIGISSVMGLALGAGKPCVSVSTLESLAWNLCCVQGLVAPVMDARRSQVYTALFRCHGDGAQRVTRDEALSIDALGRRLESLGEPVTLVGDGAALCHGLLARRARLRLCPAQLRHQRAGSVAAVAALREQTISPADLRPSYLRLPQAERELLEKTLLKKKPKEEPT